MIDDHAHPFKLEFSPLNLPEFALDTRSGAEAVARREQLGPGRLYQHLLERWLGQLLGVETADAVVARDAEASSNWSAWVRRLLDDAEIHGMIFDAAVDCEAPTALTDHAALVARPIWHMARIDPCVDTLIAQGASAQEIVRAVETYVTDSVARGCVAFKTVLAYRTGLAVDPTVDLAAAQRSLHDDSVPVKRRGKALRDLILRTVLARCADLAVPIQIHTGIGDSDLRLGDSNPLHLERLLDTPEGTAATVVLIHGSFPWGRQAAYLASVRPNVWVELSLSNLFAPLSVADELASIVDLAPRGRIVVGTDGHGVPESHWFGGRMLAEAWRSVADRLMTVGADVNWIEDTRAAVMDGNARQLYGLTEP